METLFNFISESIAKIGVTNTIISTIITLGALWIYTNSKKEKKVLESTVDVQNKTILEAINAQNSVLYEIQRISLGIAELTSHQNGRLDSLVTIFLSLTRKDFTKINTNTNTSTNNTPEEDISKGGS